MALGSLLKPRIYLCYYYYCNHCREIKEPTESSLGQSPAELCTVTHGIGETGAFGGVGAKGWGKGRRALKGNGNRPRMELLQWGSN